MHQLLRVIGRYDLPPPPFPSPPGYYWLTCVVKQGAGVVTTRAHVHYLVTEYGVAFLFGKSMSKRARELIAIAHPDDRQESSFSTVDLFDRCARFQRLIKNTYINIYIYVFPLCPCFYFSVASVLLRIFIVEKTEVNTVQLLLVKTSDEICTRNRQIEITSSPCGIGLLGAINSCASSRDVLLISWGCCCCCCHVTFSWTCLFM